jgi:hypothetical protein
MRMKSIIDIVKLKNLPSRQLRQKDMCETLTEKMAPLGTGGVVHA